MSAVSRSARGRRARRAVVLAAAMVSAGALVAGCSSGSSDPGVAAASTPTASSASPSATATGAAQALQFASCMRSHGEPNFPDPTVKNGSVGFDISPSSGIDTQSQTYANAARACSAYRGGGTTGNNSANLAKELKFSQCMRSHGVPDFPDPNKNGGFSGTSSVNPGSPTFQNAQSTCMQISGLGSGSSSNGSGSS